MHGGDRGDDGELRNRPDERPRTQPRWMEQQGNRRLRLDDDDADSRATDMNGEVRNSASQLAP
jgi:hypothetical protein